MTQSVATMQIWDVFEAAAAAETPAALALISIIHSFHRGDVRTAVKEAGRVLTMNRGGQRLSIRLKA